MNWLSKFPLKNLSVIKSQQTKGIKQQTTKVFNNIEIEILMKKP